MKHFIKIFFLALLTSAIFHLQEGFSQNPSYFISPPAQSNPTVVNWSSGGSYSVGLDKNTDLTLNLTADVVGTIHICGGRHIRVYGNGHKVSGIVRLLNNGGSSNSGATTGGGDVGDPGSFYVEGVYWPKYQYLYGSAGSNCDCITIYNHSAPYFDGRSVKCVIIQRCGAFGIWGGSGAIGHGDFYQVQGGTGFPLKLGYTYISNCTVSTGFTGFQYYKQNPGGDGMLYDNPRMRMVNMNWKPYYYTDTSVGWCNVNSSGQPTQGGYFAVGLDRSPINVPGPGLHLAVLETYAETIERNGGERNLFNPNNLDANSPVYEYRPGDGTVVLNDYVTRQKSVYMSSVVKLGAPSNGDFMPESAFSPTTWKNIGEPGGPSFLVNYQDGKLPEEMGIPFPGAVTGLKNESNASKLVTISPNPVTNDFRINIAREILLKNAVLTISNMHGMKVKALKINSHELSLNGNDFVNGMYFYMITIGKAEIGSGKFVVKH